jgi:argininosuccinate lyase
MKLWQSNQDSSDYAMIIEKFTIGRDNEFDLLLAKHDIIGSKAHCTMLHAINVLSQSECEAIHSVLDTIASNIEKGSFTIEDGIEDIHSQIEFELVQQLGDIGKKIHTGRSRNDQSLLDIKLFIKEELSRIASLTESLFETLLNQSEQYSSNLMPGYTHMQLAMPSSFGLWFSAYAESLSEDLLLIGTAYELANTNPLGSGAGYGSSFPLDRDLTTKELGMSRLNVNSIYAQMTRGKIEKITAYALSSIASTLSKLSMDICFFMNQHVNLIGLSKEFTTGSSIMPHKKNPDVFELIRAKCNRIQALPNELTLLTNNLISGYHRDFQLTKECLFPALRELASCLDMTHLMISNLTINTQVIEEELYAVLFSVEEVNRRVLAGMPFRDAYMQISNEIENGTFSAERSVNHTHIGSIGNLCNDLIKQQFEKRMEVFG